MLRLAFWRLRLEHTLIPVFQICSVLHGSLPFLTCLSVDVWPYRGPIEICVLRDMVCLIMAWVSWSQLVVLETTMSAQLLPSFFLLLYFFSLFFFIFNGWAGESTAGMGFPLVWSSGSI